MCEIEEKRELKMKTHLRSFVVFCNYTQQHQKEITTPLLGMFQSYRRKLSGTLIL